MGVPQTRYVKGEWNAVCDECGFTFKSSKLRKRWDGAMVCQDDWEPRHPQDLIKVRTEKTGVPWSRPQEAVAASSYTDPITEDTVNIDPVSTFVTFGPVDPDSL